MTTSPLGNAVLLGTVAIEPNRWSTIDPSGAPVADLAHLADPLAAAGIDGLEVWERHIPTDATDARALADQLPPIVVLNSYVSFDSEDATALQTVVGRVDATGTRAVKFNVGNDRSKEADYIQRVSQLRRMLPSEVVLLCECHAHISIAEEPEVAARLLSSVGPPESVGAIVHTHEPVEHIRARFDAYGDRIHHVHVNFLDQSTMTVPVLADRREELTQKVQLLRELGFDGSWTLEFVEGVLTERDDPAVMLDRAVEDLAVLHDVLGVRSDG